MSIHRYPPRSLYADYARAGAGLLLTVGPLVSVPLSPWVAVPLGACALLFLAFALKALLRQLSSIELTDEAVVLHGPVSRTIGWNELTAFALSYYATRRERGSGWMQLSLKGRGHRIAAESTLDGFDQLVRRANEAARRNGVPLSDRTIANLEALGIELPLDPDNTGDPGLVEAAPDRS